MLLLLWDCLVKTRLRNISYWSLTCTLMLPITCHSPSVPSIQTLFFRRVIRTVALTLDSYWIWPKWEGLAGIQWLAGEGSLSLSHSSVIRPLTQQRMIVQMAPPLYLDFLHLIFRPLGLRVEHMTATSCCEKLLLTFFVISFTAHTSFSLIKP